MRVWAIIWRIVWVLFAAAGLSVAFESCAGSGDDIIMAILGFCLTCIIVNIPIYIWTWVQRDELDNWISALEWDVYPVRTLILNILFAPLVTVYAAFKLAIQAIGLIFGRYDV